jgi:hypothetical protein
LITGLNELSLTINYLDITDPVETLMWKFFIVFFKRMNRILGYIL